MSIQDVIKNSFLESFSNTFTLNSIFTMAVALVVALLFGLFICLIYHKSVSYTHLDVYKRQVISRTGCATKTAF